jgi:hypothetical protein
LVQIGSDLFKAREEAAWLACSKPLQIKLWRKERANQSTMMLLVRKGRLHTIILILPHVMYLTTRVHRGIRVRRVWRTRRGELPVNRDTRIRTSRRVGRVGRARTVRGELRLHRYLLELPVHRELRDGRMRMKG